MIKNIKDKLLIKKAFKNNEFILYYQPVCDINYMNICSMESLLRWDDPDRGILLPDYFIDIIEQNGLINEIGRFVFYETCKQVKTYHNLGYKDMTASVNICESQLDDSFIDFAYNTITSADIDARYIYLEITERAFLNPDDKMMNCLNELKKIGFKLYIDDFGIKYSSFNCLRYFPFDGIKIDKIFIDHMHDSEKSSIIIKNIIRLAHELKLDVVAEGVEQNNQLNYLKDINCDKIQGFLLGRPVCANEFTAYLRKFNKCFAEILLH